MINRLVSLIFLLFFQLLSGQKNKSFDSIIHKIDKGQYPIAWNSISHYYNKRNISHEEKLFLEAKILRDQGAHHLALESIDQLEVLIYPNKIKDWGEQLLTLKSDLYYQLYEFDLYLKHIELLEKWRRHFKPDDSLRIALNYAYRAKYFSAMVSADSARFNTCNALKLYWKHRDQDTDLPVYQIYANHVSCLRNGMGFEFDSGIENSKKYIDTCLLLINKRFPDENIEKLRILQSLAMPFYDQASAISTWINPKKTAIEGYKLFHLKVNPIINRYEKLAGKRHPYIAQIHYLLGMLELYQSKNTEAIKHFEQSKIAVSSCSIQQPIYYLNWKRVITLIKYIARLKHESKEHKNELIALLQYNFDLQEAEQVFFLRYFFLQLMNAEAEDDVYTMVPFSELAWVNLQLFQKTKNPIYLDKAWDYSQKNKYLDLLKSKLLPEKRQIANKVTVFLSHEIKEIRLLNDSLFLSENKFADFSKISKEMLAKKIYSQYKSMNRVFSNSNLPDPLASNYFNGKLSYTLENLKTKLSTEKSAWISINNYSNERYIHSMVWVICPDTEFVKLNTWEIKKNFIAYDLHEKLINYKSDSVNIISNQIYKILLKESTLILKRKGINRLYYCDDTVHPIGNIELFSTEINRENPRYLIHDFSVTHELMVLPDALLNENTKESTSNISYLVCPILDNKRINLSLARAYSDSIARFINGTVCHSFFGKRNFLKTLENANVLNLFSHGEGANGIVFSDGNLLPNEVRNLKTNAELVSLVTCESSAGKLIHGDGVKGMTEALIHAGARRVITTKWKIDEKASVILMLYFYKNLSNGMRADSALRMAKLKYINEADINEQHPSFWGGIILFGEASEIKSLTKFLPFIEPIHVIALTICGFLLAFSTQCQFRKKLINIVKDLNRPQ